MDAYSDAKVMCIHAIRAIRKRALEDGEDPEESEHAKLEAYVPSWLWNVATGPSSSQGTSGVATELAISKSAEEWSRGLHALYLTEGAAGVVPVENAATVGGTNVGNDVLTNLATTLALQVTDRAAITTATPKKGFEAFPIATQQMNIIRFRERRRRQSTHGTCQRVRRDSGSHERGLRLAALTPSPSDAVIVERHAAFGFLFEHKLGRVPLFDNR